MRDSAHHALLVAQTEEWGSSIRKAPGIKSRKSFPTPMEDVEQKRKFVKTFSTASRQSQVKILVVVDTT
jgi:hypothetical protein